MEPHLLVGPVGLLIASPSLGRWAVGAALLMAFTRVYVGAHSPQDVLAGFVLRGLVARIGWLLLRRVLIAVTGRVRCLPVAQDLLRSGGRRALPCLT